MKGKEVKIGIVDEGLKIGVIGSEHNPGSELLAAIKKAVDDDVKAIIAVPEIDDRWRKIEDFRWDIMWRQIHCDTRDFHIAGNIFGEPPEHIVVSKLQKYGDDFFYSKDEVREYLDKLMKKAEIRPGRFKQISIRRWWDGKYVRCYWISEVQKYVFCSSHGRAFRKQMIEDYE